MEHTEGLGRTAEVWVDGHLLTVCDGVSTASTPCPPGLLAGVKFSYPPAGEFSWAQAAADNPGKKRQIEHLRNWSYAGYGQVLSIMPVVVDFGLIRMEDANWTNDESLLGRFVRIPIDRLEISHGGTGYPNGW